MSSRTRPSADQSGLAGPTSDRPALMSRASRVLAAVCGALAGLLGIRLLFRLLQANPANPISGVVYAVTQPLLFPWSHWWPPTTLPVVSFERATLVALGCYLLVGIALASLAQATAGRSTPGP